VKIIRQIPPLRKWLQQARNRGGKIAFIPTMGALHQGHLDLMIRGRKLVGKNGKVVVSIFVNPTQFNQKADLKKYPRQLSKDAGMCKNVGVDIIFAPSADLMYSSDFSTWVEENYLSLSLCGAKRPGHFKGVCTVVAKLFNLVQPDIAIFGHKDAQQLAIIKRMVRDLNFPIRIVAAPIVREKDGLAMSSRNQRLSSRERSLAPKIYLSLRGARLKVSEGERSAARIKSFVRGQLSKIHNSRIDYIEIVDQESLKSVSQVRKHNLLAVALFLGEVRLIDNIIL
jgi:pantoate--beta-alanine ligase